MLEAVIRMTVPFILSEFACGLGKWTFRSACHCLVFEELSVVSLGMYNMGSLQGGIGAGCPGTCEYDQEGSSEGSVS